MTSIKYTGIHLGAHRSHSGSRTSRWRRSSRKGLVGRSEAPCSLAQSHMTPGSYGQTFLLCRLQTIRERQIHKCVYLNSFSFAVSCLNLPCKTSQRTHAHTRRSLSQNLPYFDQYKVAHMRYCINFTTVSTYG